VYGSASLADIQATLATHCPSGVSCEVRQTDSEAELISWLHDAIDQRSPVVLNPAAFTHYSYALRDAAQMVTQAGLPLIEIHLSNPHARESFRHQSVISGVATGVIAGFGADSYLLAMQQITRLIGQ
jgi:3-dehydroquinate dehydratase-2